MSKLLIVTPFYPPSIGGMERAVERLAIALSRTGVEVEVHTSVVIDGDGCDRDSSSGPIVCRKGESLQSWGNEAENWVRARSADAVLVTSFGPDARRSMINICEGLRRRSVRTVWRTPTSDHARRNLASPEIETRQLFDLVVANSAASGRCTEQILGIPVTVIPNLLLMEELEAALIDARSERWADVVWVGRVSARKNPMVLARVLNELAEHQVVSVQAAPAYGEMTLFRSFMTALSPLVKVASPSLSQPLEVRRGRAFVHLSGVEGSPNAVLEACARGMFPILKDIPACVELVEGLHARLIEDLSTPILPLVKTLAEMSTKQTRLDQHSAIAARHNEENIVSLWLEALFS